MWSALTLVTAPALTPVSLDEAKAQCHVDHSDEDVLLTLMIAAAVAMIDGPDGIGHCMITQTWSGVIDGWQNPIVLPLGPVSAVTAITYLDSDGASQILGSGLYRLVNGVRPAFIERAYGASWPAHRAVSYPISIAFTAGVATAAEVDQGLRQAVLMLVGHWYANRETVNIGDVTSEMEFTFHALTERLRVGRFA